MSTLWGREEKLAFDREYEAETEKSFAPVTQRNRSGRKKLN